MPSSRRPALEISKRCSPELAEMASAQADADPSPKRLRLRMRTRRAGGWPSSFLLFAACTKLSAITLPPSELRPLLASLTTSRDRQVDSREAMGWTARTPKALELKSTLVRWRHCANASQIKVRAGGISSMFLEMKMLSSCATLYRTKRADQKPLQELRIQVRYFEVWHPADQFTQSFACSHTERVSCQHDLLDALEIQVARKVLHRGSSFELQASVSEVGDTTIGRHSYRRMSHVHGTDPQPPQPRQLNAERPVEFHVSTTTPSSILSAQV